MCSRFSQREAAEVYATRMGWERHAGDPGSGPKYNVSPGTMPMVLHRLSGEPAVSRIFWGYSPRWHEKSPAINARLDTVLRQSPFWKPVLSRRIVVPVDGWFEWTGEQGVKQPWFIHPKDDRPALLAGMTGWEPGSDDHPNHGMTIITDDGAGGMVDIHDRRPIALAPDDANAWVDSGLSVDDALLLLSTPRPESEFGWWKVSYKISNRNYQSPDATAPI